eukprot:gene17257-biopygen20360
MGSPPGHPSNVQTFLWRSGSPSAHQEHPCAPDGETPAGTCRTTTIGEMDALQPSRRVFLPEHPARGG